MTSAIVVGETNAPVQILLILVLSIPLEFRPASVLSAPLVLVLLALVAITFVGFGSGSHPR